MNLSIQGVPEFNRAVREAVKVLPQKVGRLHRLAAAEGTKRTRARTPVDRGWLRNAWRLALGAPAAGPTQSESDPFKANLAVAGAIPPYSVSYLTNTAPYAATWENGGFVPPNPPDDEEARKKRAASRRPARRRQAARATGDPGGTFVRDGHSIQAPQGMLRVAFAEVVQLVRLAVSRGGRA